MIERKEILFFPDHHLVDLVSTLFQMMSGRLAQTPTDNFSAKIETSEGGDSEVLALSHVRHCSYLDAHEHCL